MLTPPSPDPERLTAEQAHAAVTTFAALFATVGLGYYGLSFFYDFMVRDFGWSRAQVTSGNAVGKVLVGPLFGFFAGWLIDHFGPRRLMLVGLLCGATALVGLSLSSQPILFYGFFVLNALGYVCGGPLPCQVLLSRRFDRRRGIAMGFAYIGIGVGGALAPRAAYLLTQRLGWQGALMALGVIFLAVSWPLAFFLKDEGTARFRQAALPSPAVGPVLRRPAFYLLALGSMASIGALGGTILNLKLYLALDRSLEQGRIAGLLSLVLTFSIAGRLLMGWLADRLPKKYVMVTIYLLVATAVPLLLLPSVPLFVFAAIFGIGLGGDYMIIPLMAAELFGVRVMGRVMGIVLTADGVAEAVVPWLVGHLRDVTGSYQAGFAVIVALASLGTLAVALLPRHGDVP
jgi:MFS family permease